MTTVVRPSVQCVGSRLTIYTLNVAVVHPLYRQLPARACNVLSLARWLARRNVTGLYITTGQPGYRNKMPTATYLGIYFPSLRLLTLLYQPE